MNKTLTEHERQPKTFSPNVNDNKKRMTVVYVWFKKFSVIVYVWFFQLLSLRLVGVLSLRCGDPAEQISLFLTKNGDVTNSVCDVANGGT